MKKNGDEIEKFCKTVQNVKQHASDLQTFLTIKQIVSEVIKNEHALQSMHDTDGITPCIRVFGTRSRENLERERLGTFSKVLCTQVRVILINSMQV